MKQTVSLVTLRNKLKASQDRLTKERVCLSHIMPIELPFEKAAYLEAYKHAEHLGLSIIKRHLKHFSWLPIQLDPDSEIIGVEQADRAEWLSGDISVQPSARNFGNEFIHTMTRAGILYGWDDFRVAQMGSRIATLFGELSCLVGIVFYVSTFIEAEQNSFLLSDPDDLFATAKEFSEMTIQKPVHIVAPAPEQIFQKPLTKEKEKHAFLHLVENPQHVDI